ncbi:unnamed protein product [Protopolystoma xenopodis]|uniref:Uncharacterized protein n=1 Tax=Protopolystoma xenopodis TaxID=117903 RepID=A0A3S4ZUC6_9PLAT|nr:unnamed protein product [Protopolystoma xenopodis]
MLAFFQRILDWIKGLFWKEEMELTIVGLQYSGKTTFLGEYHDDMIPTVGFNMRKVVKGNVWDIGGQPRFRTDPDKLEAARNELHNLLDRSQLMGIPVLVLGNKRDLPGALAENELISVLNLGAITDREICCYSISCKERENIDITLQWLIKHSKSG